MKGADVKAILDRVLMWSAGAQQEAVASLRAIEAERLGDDYHVTPEKVDAIDDAVCSGAINEDEVEVAFHHV